MLKFEASLKNHKNKGNVTLFGVKQLCVMKIKSFTNVQGIQWVPSRMGPKFNNAM